MKRTIHLLPNAHLDPVWLWDWREGLNEGVTTVAAVLNLMDEFPDLTFIRGEAAIYQHLQRTAPKTFDRVLSYIEAGRWDVVGGTYVQPDSNLSSTETLCRHFEYGLSYFEKELHKRPTIAWQADSFGHPAGWPNIMQNFGLEGFAFTRPQRREFTMASPAFWWEGDSGKRILAYRQHSEGYLSERDNIAKVLDDTLADAQGLPLSNIGLLFGLGNHGGGPTRRHIEEVCAWKMSHPHVDVVYSTLHGFFKELNDEIAGLAPEQVPSIRGEFGYCLRGCHSSVQRFKTLFREAEANVTSAEITQSVIGYPAPSGLDHAWESVLFNSFHDILPGTSIERATHEQELWIGGATHAATRARFEALNHLADQIDTRVDPPFADDQPTNVPALIWNPLPRPFEGLVELEVALDYRPLFAYEKCPDEVPYALFDAAGQELPFQEIATEHSAYGTLPWRKRVVFPVTLPPLGWQVVKMGLVKNKPEVLVNTSGVRASETGMPWVSNARWKISLSETGGLSVHLDGKPFFGSERNLEAITVEDPWGSWGGMQEELESHRLDDIRHKWTITHHEILERGPHRVALWTRWQAGNSWMDLTFSLNPLDSWISVDGRLLWNERNARLQLCIPSTGPALCDVPGGVVKREVRGQVPVGRWFVRKNTAGCCVGVASDVLSATDFLPQETRLSLARASRYAATDSVSGIGDQLWRPAIDCGELKFRLSLFSDGMDPDHVVDRLLYPPTVLPVPPSDGVLPPHGSLGELKPDSVRLLSLQRKDDRTLKLRVQNRGATCNEATFQIGETLSVLGEISPQEIVTKEVSLD